MVLVHYPLMGRQRMNVNYYPNKITKALNNPWVLVLLIMLLCDYSDNCELDTVIYCIHTACHLIYHVYSLGIKVTEYFELYKYILEINFILINVLFYDLTMVLFCLGLLISIIIIRICTVLIKYKPIILSYFKLHQTVISALQSFP